MGKSKADTSVVVETIDIDVIKPNAKPKPKNEAPHQVFVKPKIEENQYTQEMDFDDPLSAWTNPNQISAEQDPTPIEIMIKEMIGTENIKMKTDLTDNLIVGLTKGSIYANMFSSNIMQQLVDNVSYYRVSKGGKGRSQIVDMAKSLGGYGSDERPSFLNRLFKGE